MSDEPWNVRLSDEVRDLYLALAERDRAVADRVIGMLVDRGPMLRMPHSRSLGDDLYELRFTCERVARRITYTFQAKRRVVTLTTFRKQRDNERREVARARAVLRRHGRYDGEDLRTDR
jgi:phage-related protein